MFEILFPVQVKALVLKRFPRAAFKSNYVYCILIKLRYFMAGSVGFSGRVYRAGASKTPN